MSIERQLEICAEQDRNRGRFEERKKPSDLKNKFFKIGDKVFVVNEKTKYIKGEVVHVTSEEISIRGTILKYSNCIRYPVGDTDIFKLKADGSRNVNGLELKTIKRNKK